MEIVFDPGYSLSGTEQFIHFGQGAYLTSLLIDGNSYDAGSFSGAGFLAGNGSFVPTSTVPDTTNVLLCLFPILLFAAAAQRRRSR